MIFIMALFYNESAGVLDIKYIVALTTGYTLQPGRNEISDFNLMLKATLPSDIKSNITIVDMRRRSNSTHTQTIKVTKSISRK